jgi:thiamine pyrophosphokinase
MSKKKVPRSPHEKYATDLQKAAQRRWQDLGTAVRTDHNLTHLLMEYRQEINEVAGLNLMDSIIKAVNHRFHKIQATIKEQRSET